MAKADRSHSTPPTSTSSPITQVTHGLFELEGPLLRVRDLTQAISMAACSPELSKEETGALQALAFTIFDEINEVIAERTRLCHLSSASERDSHGSVTSKYIHALDTALIMAADTISGYIQGLLDGIEFKQTAYALDRDSRRPRSPVS